MAGTMRVFVGVALISAGLTTGCGNKAQSGGPSTRTETYRLSKSVSTTSDGGIVGSGIGHALTVTATVTMAGTNR